MDHKDSAQVEAPTSIIARAIKRLEGNVGAIEGQIKALEEKLVPVMVELKTDIPEEGQKPVDGHMGVPIAMSLQNMSVSLEGYYKRLDELLQRIEI